MRFECLVHFVLPAATEDHHIGVILYLCSLLDARLALLEASTCCLGPVAVQLVRRTYKSTALSHFFYTFLCAQSVRPKRIAILAMSAFFRFIEHSKLRHRKAQTSC